MKLYSLLTITYVAAQKQDAIDRATAIEHWETKGTCSAKQDGYANNKCDNDDGWCCHGDDSVQCLDNIVESLKRNYEYKHAERKGKEQEWWCMVPREKRTAKERAQIEKCLKSFDPSKYNTDHGKIGFFHRLLSKIVSERIDRPHYQCNTINKLRENFVNYLKLRKSCAKDTSAWKKKENAKAKKEAEREEKEEERKLKKEAAKEKKQEKKAEKQAEKAEAAGEGRKRREDESEEDFYFDENNKSEVVDAEADAELNSLFDSLMKLEDNDQMTTEDLQAFFDSDCTGDDIDVDMCQEVANILTNGADTRSEEEKASMEVLIKVSKARRGIVSWSKSFIPAELTRCRKKRNKLNMKTRSTVSRMLDMRKRFNTNPDKLAAARRQKKAKITAKSLRIETAKNRAAEKKQKEQDKKERVAEKAAAVEERLANKAEREQALAERTAKQEAKAAAKAAAEAESSDVQE